MALYKDASNKDSRRASHGSDSVAAKVWRPPPSPARPPPSAVIARITARHRSPSPSKRGDLHTTVMRPHRIASDMSVDSSPERHTPTSCEPRFSLPPRPMGVTMAGGSGGFGGGGRVTDETGRRRTIGRITGGGLGTGRVDYEAADVVPRDAREQDFGDFGGYSGVSSGGNGVMYKHDGRAAAAVLVDEDDQEKVDGGGGGNMPINNRDSTAGVQQSAANRVGGRSGRPLAGGGSKTGASGAVPNHDGRYTHELSWPTDAGTTVDVARAAGANDIVSRARRARLAHEAAQGGGQQTPVALLTDADTPTTNGDYDDDEDDDVYDEEFDNGDNDDATSYDDDSSLCSSTDYTATSRSETSSTISGALSGIPRRDLLDRIPSEMLTSSALGPRPSAAGSAVLGRLKTAGPPGPNARPSTAARLDNNYTLYRSRFDSDDPDDDGADNPLGSITENSSGLVAVRRSTRMSGQFGEEGGGGGRGIRGQGAITGNGGIEGEKTSTAGEYYPWLLGRRETGMVAGGADTTQMLSQGQLQAHLAESDSVSTAATAIDEVAQTTVTEHPLIHGHGVANGDNLDKTHADAVLGDETGVDASPAAAPAAMDAPAAAVEMEVVLTGDAVKVEEEEDGNLQPFARLFAAFSSPARWLDTLGGISKEGRQEGDDDKQQPQEAEMEENGDDDDDDEEVNVDDGTMEKLSSVVLQGSGDRVQKPSSGLQPPQRPQSLDTSRPTSAALSSISVGKEVDSFATLAFENIAHASNAASAAAMSETLSPTARSKIAAEMPPNPQRADAAVVSRPSLSTDVSTGGSAPQLLHFLSAADDNSSHRLAAAVAAGDPTAAKWGTLADSPYAAGKWTWGNDSVTTVDVGIDGDTVGGDALAEATDGAESDAVGPRSLSDAVGDRTWGDSATAAVGGGSRLNSTTGSRSSGLLRDSPTPVVVEPIVTNLTVGAGLVGEGVGGGGRAGDGGRGGGAGGGGVPTGDITPSIDGVNELGDVEEARGIRRILKERDPVSVLYTVIAGLSDVTDSSSVRRG